MKIIHFNTHGNLGGAAKIASSVNSNIVALSNNSSMICLSNVLNKFKLKVGGLFGRFLGEDPF